LACPTCPHLQAAQFSSLHKTAALAFAFAFVFYLGSCFFGGADAAILKLTMSTWVAKRC
jgi:hypothetical protein